MLALVCLAGCDDLSIGVAPVTAGCSQAAPPPATRPAAPVPASGPVSAAPAGSFRPGQLNGVAAVSARSAWAAGYTGNHTLMLHWDGKTWTHVPTPSPGSDPEFLGVAATSADYAWEVGLSGDDHTLIAHWDGKTWTRQADRR